MLADLDERLEKRGKGGVEIEKKRLLALAYVDDLVPLAKEEGGMRLMIRKLKEYLKEKRHEVNSGKSKILRFGKRVRKGREGKRRWAKNEIEEVKQYKYLGLPLKEMEG